MCKVKIAQIMCTVSRILSTTFARWQHVSLYVPLVSCSLPIETTEREGIPSTIVTMAIPVWWENVIS